MEFTTFISQLLAIALGVLLALVFTFYIIWPKIENLLFKINSLQQHKSVLKNKQQLHFAAYERLLLFTYRISPKEVMLRNHQGATNLDNFKQAIIADIENEFHHNFTQQLYVSDVAWKLVKDLKENTLALFRNTAYSLGEDVTLEQYIDSILKHIQLQEVNPYEATQVLLKREMVSSGSTI